MTGKPSPIAPIRHGLCDSSGVTTPITSVAAGFGGSWPWPAPGCIAPPPKTDSIDRCDRYETAECRILLNDAQLEIDRLRRGLDRLDCAQSLAAAQDCDDDDRPPDTLAAPPDARSTSGLPPLGKPTPSSPPPPLPPALVLHLDQVITNVGSLIDRLI